MPRGKRTSDILCRPAAFFRCHCASPSMPLITSSPHLPNLVQGVKCQALSVEKRQWSSAGSYPAGTSGPCLQSFSEPHVARPPCLVYVSLQHCVRRITPRLFCFYSSTSDGSLRLARLESFSMSLSTFCQVQLQHRTSIMPICTDPGQGWGERNPLVHSPASTASCRESCKGKRAKTSHPRGF